MNLTSARLIFGRLAAGAIGALAVSVMVAALSTAARAQSVFNLGLSPFSTASERLPQAFTGIGISGSYYYYNRIGDFGAGITGLSQGSGSAFSIPFRFYFRGTAPRSGGGDSAGDLDAHYRPVAVYANPTPFYAEIGPMLFQGSNTVPHVGTETLIGLGLAINAGTELNVWKLGKLYFQMGYLRSFSGAVASLNAGLGICLPVSF